MGYTPNNPYIPGDPYSYDLRWFVNNLDAIKKSIIRLEQTYTTPTVVDLAADMVDINKIYVYVGNEVGYQTDHWYYYDINTLLWTDGGIYGSIAPDATLDASSTNAVENRVITNALAAKFDTADIDSALDAGSSNPVENSVITNALAAKFDTADIDSALNASSTNPVQNGVITNALAGKQNTLTLPLAISQGGTGQTGVSAPDVSSCSRISGSTLTYQEFKQWGHLGQLYIILTTDRTYNPGEMIFTGLTTKLPALNAVGSGYFSTSEFEMAIDTAGGISVDVLGQAVPSGAVFSITVTYLLA